jgi:hypothetical protein
MELSLPDMPFGMGGRRVRAGAAAVTAAMTERIKGADVVFSTARSFATKR